MWGGVWVEVGGIGKERGRGGEGGGEEGGRDNNDFWLLGSTWDYFLKLREAAEYNV